MAAGEPDASAAPEAGADTRTAHRVAEELLLRSATLTAAAARVRARNDAEAVHDVRVAARRLETTLRLWSPLADAAGGRAAVRARRGARRLRLAAAGARELEVNVALLEASFAPPATVVRPAFMALLDQLRDRRERARAEAAEALRHSRLERVADRVAAVVASLVASPDLVAAAERRLQSLRERAAALLLDAADTLDDARLHAARVAVKKWRYAEESRAAVRSNDRTKSASELRAVQTALGAVHDHAMLRDQLRRLTQDAARSNDRERSQTLDELRSRVERARLELLPGLPRRLRALAAATTS